MVVALVVVVIVVVVIVVVVVVVVDVVVVLVVEVVILCRLRQGCHRFKFPAMLSKHSTLRWPVRFTSSNV